MAEANTSSASSGSGYNQKDIEDNKVFAVLAYLGVLFLVPLLAAPKSRFAQFHANQGLILFIADIAISIAALLLSALTFGFGALLFFPAAWAFALVFTILGIINAAKGEAKELPLIGGFKILNNK